MDPFSTRKYYLHFVLDSNKSKYYDVMIHFLKFVVLRDPSFYIFKIDSKTNYSSYLSTKNNYLIRITLAFKCSMVMI